MRTPSRTLIDNRRPAPTGGPGRLSAAWSGTARQRHPGSFPSARSANRHAGDAQRRKPACPAAESTTEQVADRHDRDQGVLRVPLPSQELREIAALAQLRDCQLDAFHAPIPGCSRSRSRRFTHWLTAPNGTRRSRPPPHLSSPRRRFTIARSRSGLACSRFFRTTRTRSTLVTLAIVLSVPSMSCELVSKDRHGGLSTTATRRTDQDPYTTSWTQLLNPGRLHGTRDFIDRFQQPTGRRPAYCPGPQAIYRRFPIT